MPIKYEFADDLQMHAVRIARIMFPHVKLDAIRCLRSFGSTSRGTIARCHAMNKVMQKALGRKKSFYVIEFISERFDKMSEEDQVKTIIHELMHIPKTFGGGFIHHNMVNERTVNQVYKKYQKLKNNNWQGFDIYGI